MTTTQNTTGATTDRAKGMKIKIEFTLDIDPAAWMETYSVSREELREDVRGYFADYCQSQLQHIGCQSKKGA